ncbi:MAG: 23S rRNA (pseudouridine(1915)-N(3))-methyltransferase RlmH [Salinivirgaceae bacterium]|nr:23S rRNA (pseudouridine(1915)-N(3))-methyltransferase RlmH [Salinivirgaceae bacterium]MDD4747206.1 23S rRNA (pseudouridine(1915)-N(3))-methyltransferase RlmH [Salinivirgaceae bacterium]
MKSLLLVVGKTNENWLSEAVNEYKNRISRYIQFEMTVIPDMKNRGKIETEKLKKQEGECILKSINDADIICLLDEQGKQYSSEGFSNWINNNFMITSKRIVFIIGGAYGFSDSVYKRANYLISLSPMTFSHQMVRIIFTEQLYRAFTIIKNEPYHHA